MQNPGTPEIMLIQQSPRVTKCPHKEYSFNRVCGLQKCKPERRSGKHTSGLQNNSRKKAHSTKSAGYKNVTQKEGQNNNTRVTKM